MKSVTYSKDAVRTLRRMPANTAQTIIAKIDQYVADPSSLSNNVTRLQGIEECYRLRVGDWRIIFLEDGQILAIFRIAPRGKAYK